MTTDRKLQIALITFCLIGLTATLMYNEPVHTPHRHIEYRVYDIDRFGNMARIPVIICHTDSADVTSGKHVKNSVSDYYFELRRE